MTNPMKQQELNVENVLVNCPVINRFSPGLYIREVLLPADTFVVGHYHRFDQLNIFLSGKITLFREDGSTETLSAPMLFTGKPGRKVAYTHTDCVWMNIHPTDETEIDKIENIFVDKDRPWPEGRALLDSILSNNTLQKIIKEEV